MAPSGARKRRKDQQELDGADNHPAKRQVLDMQQETPKTVEKPTLLTLPGEIRNAIWAETYDYYDPDDRRIDITCFRPFPSMPTAAAVCRQMMAEVLGVFLYQTKFVIWIDGCEGKRDVRVNTAYLRLCKLQREIGKVESAPSKLSEAKKAPTRIISGRPVFAEVVKWAKSIHASDLDLFYDTIGRLGWQEDLFDMLQTAVDMRKKPWKQVKKVLWSIQRDVIEYEPYWFTGFRDVHSDYTESDDSDCTDSDTDLDDETASESGESNGEEGDEEVE